MAIALGLTAGVAVLEPAPPFSPSAAQWTDETYWRAACGTPGRVLAVAWNGNQHVAHFLFAFDEPFRLHDCGELGTVVPESMISALYEPSFVEFEALVTSVRAEHTMVLGTPPPKPEEDIRAGLSREPVLFELNGVAGESADTIRIMPAELRVGLWEILQAELEVRAARIGAIFVPVPASAKTVEGCLKSEYSVGDASHANGAFGALMLGEIEAALAQAEVVRS